MYKEEEHFKNSTNQIMYNRLTKNWWMKFYNVDVNQKTQETGKGEALRVINIQRQGEQGQVPKTDSGRPMLWLLYTGPRATQTQKLLPRVCDSWATTLCHLFSCCEMKEMYLPRAPLSRFLF